MEVRLGFCFWDIVATAFLLFVVGFYFYKRKKLKDQIEDLEEQISSQTESFDNVSA